VNKCVSGCVLFSTVQVFGSPHPMPALRLVTRKHYHWTCTRGNSWNTFDTGGV
jgi:hypothetical protein